MKKIFLTLALPIILAFPVAAFAQDTTPAAPADTAAEEHPGVSAVMETYVMRTRMDEDGLPVLDDQGAEIVDEVPVSEDAIVPGDEIKYVIGFSNLGEEIDSLELAFDVPPTLVLVVDSVTASTDAVFGFSTDDSHTDISPLFTDLGDNRTVNEAFLDLTSGDRIRLHASIPVVEKEGEFTLSYNLNVR